MYELDSYMDVENIVYLQDRDKKNVLEKMVKLSFDTGKIGDLEKFRTAILDREAIMSTGLGLGLAVPHAKLRGIEEFFVTIGILKNPVEWQAIDDQPVSLVFMIGGPDDRQQDYLGILSKLVLFTKNKDRHEGILKASTPEEVISLFTTRN
ncbi:MAG: PTS sugar transporter subunit IIA [Spirochaetales bacterium]|nr:PTS sugar transporter subunit IIA [Spirochaetales bacterium]